MITQNDTPKIDYGLSVTYDGKGYTLLCDGIVKAYPVGGLISEYCRLAPTTIKDVSRELCHRYLSQKEGTSHRCAVSGKRGHHGGLYRQ